MISEMIYDVSGSLVDCTGARLYHDVKFHIVMANLVAPLVGMAGTAVCMILDTQRARQTANRDFYGNHDVKVYDWTDIFVM